MLRERWRGGQGREGAQRTPPPTHTHIRTHNQMHSSSSSHQTHLFSSCLVFFFPFTFVYTCSYTVMCLASYPLKTSRHTHTHTHSHTSYTHFIQFPHLSSKKAQRPSHPSSIISCLMALLYIVAHVLRLLLLRV